MTHASRQRWTVLLPSLLLALGVVLLLFRTPSEFPIISLLLNAFVWMLVLARLWEIALLFAALVTLLDLSLLLSAVADASVAAQILILWLGVLAARRFLLREIKDRDTSDADRTGRQERVKALLKEKTALERRLAELGRQTSGRAHLFHAAESLAGLLDATLLRQRLLELVRADVRGGTVQFFAGRLPRDPLDRWVMDHKQPLLVTDLTRDSRFRPLRASNEVRSVLAAPFIVQDQWVGLVRLNSFEPQAYSVAELRLLETANLIASLALNNLQLTGRLKVDAERDPLTGLYGQRFFVERLNEEILRAARFKTDFTLMLISVDDFARYNDTYGHAAGDELLVHAARVLKQNARPVDVLAHDRQERFAAILPQAPLGPARILAEGLRSALVSETFSFGAESAMTERVTVRAGLASFPTDATTASQLVRVAETRLRDAGPNQVIG